ncbi:MAG: SDR family oxidoreductase [Bacteriovoracaceae bacterium]|nr:SDR family oxidoreductase [Bacteriovoracaceae bacterium]
MRSLVIAANGLIGKAVVSELRSRNKPFTGSCFSRNNNGYEFLDITDFKSVESFLKEEQPGFVYLCANMPGGVNGCEREVKKAHAFHVQATKNISNLCLEIGARLIFISSDYVFSDGSIPYHEDDESRPLNAYGKLKVDAEKVIQETLKDYIIARTTNVFGWDPETKTPNFFMGLFRKLSDGQEVEVPSCLFGSPTLADDLALALIELAESDQTGIFHIVGPEFINRYEWALKICEKFDFEKSLIKELKDFKNQPRRPLRAELSTDKLSKILSWSLRNVDQAFESIIKKMN